MPRAKRYSSPIRIGTRSQLQEGVTPFSRAKMMITTRLIRTLMTAVRVAEMTTMYFGKLILRMRSLRATTAWIP